MDLMQANNPYRYSRHLLLLVVLLCLWPGQNHADPLAEVWLIDDGGRSGIALDALAVYLKADLASHQLKLSPEAPRFPDNTNVLAWLRDQILPPELTAAVWLERKNDNSKQGKPLDFLIISIYFPASGTLLARHLALSGEAPANAPLAAIVTAMIVNQRPSISRQRAQIPRPASLPKGATPPADTPSNQRLMLDADATFQIHPQSDSLLFGATLSIAYSPRSPLGLLLSASLLDTVGLDHPRYHLNYLAAPILAGGRGSFRFGGHDLRLDAGMLAAISHVDFSDSLDVVPPTSETRVNVGFMLALGYTYYPVDLWGVGIRLALGFTPRVQRYVVNNEALFAPGEWFLQVGLGIRIDPLK